SLTRAMSNARSRESGSRCAWRSIASRSETPRRATCASACAANARTSALIAFHSLAPVGRGLGRGDGACHEVRAGVDRAAQVSGRRAGDAPASTRPSPQPSSRGGEGAGRGSWAGPAQFGACVEVVSGADASAAGALDRGDTQHAIGAGEVETVPVDGEQGA